MKILRIEDFLGGEPILREEAFRRALDAWDWESLRGEEALIKGCSSVAAPVWAYLLLASRAHGVARAVYFGDAKSPIRITNNGSG